MPNAFVPLNKPFCDTRYQIVLKNVVKKVEHKMTNNDA
jgi:hypothetical protein